MSGAAPTGATEDLGDRLIALVPELRAFARTYRRDAAAADDLVQDTILKAWSNIDKFQEGTNLRAWLFTILRNTFLSEVRKRRREVEDADGAYAAQLYEKPSQDALLEFEDFQSALAKLPDDQREALVLVGASGFTYDEAAEVMGCAAGTVKSRVSRARTRLAALMKVEDPATIGVDALAAAVAGGVQASRVG